MGRNISDTEIFLDAARVEVDHNLTNLEYFPVVISILLRR